MGRTGIAELALEGGMVGADKLEHARRNARGTGDQALAHSMLSLGHISENQYVSLLSRHLSLPLVKLVEETIDPQAPHLLQEDFVRRHNALPIRIEDDELTVAVFPPVDPSALDEIELTTGYKAKPVIASLSEIQLAINQSFTTQRRTNQTIVDMQVEEYRPGAREGIVIDEIADTVDSPPVVRLVVDIIDGAINERASDIHLEPQENAMRVRYRIDGVLHDVMHIPYQAQASVVSRIKILSGMDITEKRLSQDGHISIRKGGREYDMRVATLLTINGEKVVMRILSRETMLMNLEKLGFIREDYERVAQLIEKPHGMLLVTGPTGCGKTTTLYSVLNRLDSASQNIVTIEDPVEFKLRGVNQSQINPSAGITFAGGLRSILRQDPNIIMVGEIRDAETAEIAIQASLTGHLVFSTLHTSDAPGAVTRLANMGVKDYLISASVIGVVAQRLVRVVCPYCKEPCRVNVKELFGQFGVNAAKTGTAVLYKGKGCKFCSGTGYRGRIGIFEVMTISEKIKDLILRGGQAPDLRRVAIQEGMNTMRHSAFRKVIEGVTTVEEVRRSVFVSMD
ncbi:MAG TPA: GspE/PulE family protein [bacterium]|mgnify:CR=1 FL=1|nr:MAG: Type II secretion system protein E [bacterium ADurb.Bin236]HPI75926.1 GspE/PulE family protein [bacterium]HPN93728.1 GspE/PulE family protein [bacterium]